MPALTDVLSVLEGPEFPYQVLRAMRNAALFATETRVPYGIVNIMLRDILFGNGGRAPIPLTTKLDSIVDGAMSHSWILARVAMIFKTVEFTLAGMEGVSKPQEWQTFIAGCVAGYTVMGPVTSIADYKLKQQVNLFIGIRTAWAVAGYMLRKDMFSSISQKFRPNSEYAKDLGWTGFVTLAWGFVMWHWRHQDKIAPREMPVAMARSMDFIYADGDTPGVQKWLPRSSYIFAALFLYRSFRDLQGSKG
eukprot:m.328197 g.328197  ORF g.328197 m.328197 type:complete len:249 (+) comp27687_c0_seq3:6339-7085(+)